VTYHPMVVNDDGQVAATWETVSRVDCGPDSSAFRFQMSHTSRLCRRMKTHA
jgi:hypothetical protein